MENTELMKKMLETLHGLDGMMQEQGQYIKKLDFMLQEQGKEIAEINQNIATKQELAEIKQELKQDIKKLDTKFNIVIEELYDQKADIKELKRNSA